MPSLSVDFAENYFGSGLPLDLVEHFKPILSKFPSHDFLMPLAEERIHIEGRSSFENFGGQLLAQSKRFHIFKGIVKNFSSHEPFKISESNSHSVVYIFLELKN